MDDLAPIIEEIAFIANRAEGNKWLLAEAIYDAFAEMPNHTQGLLQGLCTRLKYTSTQVYNYSHGWRIRSGYDGEAELSVSHFAKLYDLIKQYGLSDHDVLVYIDMAHVENLSVRDLAILVSQNHDPDIDLKDRKYFETTVKRMRKCWMLPLFENVPKLTREAYYKVMQELEGMI